MADMMFALGQTKKKKKEENKVRQTKSELKDVTITDTIEKDIRKEHHDRDQKWKATGRDQIKKNTNFDMARSLFGGGNATAGHAEEDEDEYVEEEIIEEEIIEEEVVEEQ
jgi:hypothetical protein